MRQPLTLGLYLAWSLLRAKKIVQNSELFAVFHSLRLFDRILFTLEIEKKIVAY